MKEVTCQLYASSYGATRLVSSVLEGKFGFELVVKSDTSMVREILTLAELQILRTQIDSALGDLPKMQELLESNRKGKVYIEPNN